MRRNWMTENSRVSVLLGCMVLGVIFAPDALAQNQSDLDAFELEAGASPEGPTDQPKQTEKDSQSTPSWSQGVIPTHNNPVPARPLILTAKFREGAEAVADRAHVVTWALTQENTWNNQVEVSLQPFAGNPEQFRLSAAATSLRRPILFGQRQMHGVGEPDRWQELKSWATTVSIAPGSENLSYSAGIAGTRYRLSNATRFQAVDTPLHDEQAWEAGTSTWHRLKASVAFGPTSQLEISGFFASRSDGFHDTAIAIEHTPILAGETREIRARWKNDDFEADVHGWRTDGNEIDARERNLTIRFRGIAVKWSKSDWNFMFDWPDSSKGLFISSEKSSELSLQFTPSTLMGNTAKPAWLPDRVLLIHGRADVNEDFSLSQATDVETEWQEMILTWHSSVSRTELGLSRRISHDNAMPHGLSSPDAALGLSVNQMFLDRDWDASFYANHDRTRSGSGGTSNWTAGFNWSLNQAELPKVTFGVDWNKYHDFSVLNRFSDEGLELSLSVDFSRFLERLGAGNEHSLLFRGFTNYNATRVQDLGKFRRVGPTAMISYNSRF